MTKFDKQLKKTTEQVKRDTYIMEKCGYKSDLLHRMERIRDSHYNRIKVLK